MSYYIGFMGEYVVQNGTREFTPKGDEIPGKKYLSAVFRKGGAVPDYARDAVSKLPQFLKGIGLDEDPYTRVMWFDSRVAQEENGWTDEEHDLVVKKLDEGQGPDFVRADQVFAKPWPSYDGLVAQGRRTIQMVADKIVEKIQEDGYEAGGVLAYETATLNRPEVVAAVEALIAGDDDVIAPNEEIVAA